MRHSRPVAAAVLAVALLPAALLPAACSSDSGSTSGPPALTAAQLRARLLTPTEAGLPGPARFGDPVAARGIVTITDSFSTNGLQVLEVLQSTGSGAIARAAVKLMSSVYGTAAGRNFRSVAFHVGDASSEHVGTESNTGTAKVAIDFARGSVTVDVSVTRADYGPGALPASAQPLAERIARAQDAKIE